MIEIYTETLAGTEVLHAVPAGAHAAALDTVVVYHGFTSSKTVYSYFAVALAQAGFRVIMPDAPDHGTRFSRDAAARRQHFWQILKRNIDEFVPLQQALLNAGLIKPERLYVAGASMGGMTALALMSAHPSLRAVACLMGSGYFSTLARMLFPPNALQTAADEQAFAAVLAPLKPYEAGQALPRLGNRPLLLWHGQNDEVVPAMETFRLQQALQQQGLDKHLTCLWEKGVPHRITASALEATVTFFCTQREER